MAHLFKKVLHSTGSKQPHDVVGRTCVALEKLTDNASEKQQEELSRCLASIKASSCEILRSTRLDVQNS